MNAEEYEEVLHRGSMKNSQIGEVFLVRPSDENGISEGSQSVDL